MFCCAARCFFGRSAPDRKKHTGTGELPLKNTEERNVPPEETAGVRIPVAPVFCVFSNSLNGLTRSAMIAFRSAVKSYPASTDARQPGTRKKRRKGGGLTVFLPPTVMRRVSYRSCMAISCARIYVTYQLRHLPQTLRQRTFFTSSTSVWLIWYAFRLPVVDWDVGWSG